MVRKTFVHICYKWQIFNLGGGFYIKHTQINFTLIAMSQSQYTMAM